MNPPHRVSCFSLPTLVLLAGLAAPIVSTISAIVWEDHPTWTPFQVKKHTMDAGDAIPALAGLCSGANPPCRRINVRNAVEGELCP